MPATSAMTAAIVVMWFSASTKLVVATVPMVSRTEAGAWASTALIRPFVTASATRVAWPAAGVPARPSRMPFATWWLKIEPRAAMPVAMPTWRKVELTPDAIPERSGATTPTAVEASGVLIMPMPMPATISPGIRCVHSDCSVLAAMPPIRKRPAEVRKKPGAISHLVGTWLVSRPARIAATNAIPDRKRNRTPDSIAE